jgi:hypothetical protein
MEKCGILHKGPKYVCSSLAIARQLISAKTNNEELLIARQRFRNHGYIDSIGYERKATNNFVAEARKQDNKLGLGVQKNARGQPVKN